MQGNTNQWVAVSEDPLAVFFFDFGVPGSSDTFYLDTEGANSLIDYASIVTQGTDAFITTVSGTLNAIRIFKISAFTPGALVSNVISSASVSLNNVGLATDAASLYI